jgi:exopolysaccharide biosynthesis predicted pyruvyltransferase EpsI
MWEEFAKLAKNKKIICYGAGNNAKSLSENASFQPFIGQIACFIDKDETKIGKVVLAKDIPVPIKGYSYLDQITDELVIVTISDYKEIGNELTNRGIQWFSWMQMQMDWTFETFKNRENKKIAVLLNTPNYLNLGDHAITVAEIDILKKYYNEVFELNTGMCNDLGLQRLKEYIDEDDVIYIQGGGNMGTLWRTCENNIRRILKTFPKNRIFIFPQSVFYGDTYENQEYLRESISIYNDHKQLKICLRDKKSYEFINSIYSCKSVLVPDMVLTINYRNQQCTRNGVGVLLRNDKERLIDEGYIKCINDVVNDLSKSVKQISHHTDDGTNDREKRLEKMLEIYSGCELVITDRLHGMLFSAITNTPCIVFDNSYGKISSLYDTWLKDNNGITFTRQLKSSELRDLILQKLKSPFNKIKSDEFKNMILSEIIK